MKKVGIVMGSDSDLPILRKTMDTLTSLGIPYECHIYSCLLYTSCYVTRCSPWLSLWESCHRR